MLKTLHKIEWEVYKGKKLLFKGEQESNSYLRNWVNFIRAHFGGTTELIVAVDGTGVNAGYIDAWCNTIGHDLEWGFWLNAPDNDDSYGLVVGYGTTPPSPEDYKLEKKYSHGSGLGYLDYDSTRISGIVLEDNKLIISVERAFYNNYESPQDITEIGLTVWLRERFPNFRNVNVKVLIMRDVLDTAVTVPAYATVVLRYNIYFIIS